MINHSQPQIKKLTSVTKILLLLIVFFTPLIGAYKNFGYEHTKVLFFIVLISLIGLFLIRQKFKWSLIAKTAGIFIIILLITSLTGINPGISLLGTQPYFQGVILYAYLFLFFLAVSWSKIKFEHWAMVLSGSATSVGLLAIKDWVLLNILNFQIPTYAGRVVSTFGQPNFFAGFLLLALPFSYLLARSSSKRLQLLGWGSGLISLIGIMVSYSRSTIFLALILLILGLLDQLKIKKFLVAVFSIIILAIFLSINSSSGFIWKEFLYPAKTLDPDLTKESVESRVYIWPVAWKIILERPLWGYGLENISQSFSIYFRTYKHQLFEENLKVSPVLISLKDLNIDRTHNYLLDLWLFSGLLGLISWLILVMLVIRKILVSKVSIKNSVLLTGLTTYLILIQFQNQSVVHLVYFWLIAGLIDQTKQEWIREQKQHELEIVQRNGDTQKVS